MANYQQRPNCTFAALLDPTRRAILAQQAEARSKGR
jgi:hypothetical protein